MKKAYGLRDYSSSLNISTKKCKYYYGSDIWTKFIAQQAYRPRYATPNLSWISERTISN